MTRHQPEGDGKRPGETLRAYRNPDFINSADARPLRILAEYLEPAARFKEAHIRDTIVFFGSARAIEEIAAARLERARQGSDPREVARAEKAMRLAAYADDARELARRMTAWSKQLSGHQRRFVVCSGGGPGVMEAANRGASEAKGETIGLNISIPTEQFANPYITRRLSFEFHYFFMRKYWFLYMAKAMAIFPGGFGTMDELMEALTLLQTRKVAKPMPIVLYGREYWDQVLDLEAMVEWGTVDREDLALFRQVDTVEEAFDHLTGELTRHYLDGGQEEHDTEPEPPTRAPD